MRKQALPSAAVSKFSEHRLSRHRDSGLKAGSHGVTNLYTEGVVAKCLDGIVRESIERGGLNKCSQDRPVLCCKADYRDCSIPDVAAYAPTRTVGTYDVGTLAKEGDVQ